MAKPSPWSEPGPERCRTLPANIPGPSAARPPRARGAPSAATRASWPGGRRGSSARRGEPLALPPLRQESLGEVDPLLELREPLAHFIHVGAELRVGRLTRWLASRPAVAERMTQRPQGPAERHCQDDDPDSDGPAVFAH